MNSKKQAKTLMLFGACLGVFMLVVLLVDSGTKPTYSITTCADIGDASTCGDTAGCSWSYSTGCTGTPTGTDTPVRPSNCWTASQCEQRAGTCQYGYTGCDSPTSYSEGFSCYTYNCNDAPAFTAACYHNSTTHKLQWWSVEPPSGWTKNSMSYTQCYNCMSGYHLSGDDCVADVTHTSLYDGECSPVFTDSFLVATSTGSGAGDCGHNYSCKYSSQDNCQTTTGFICEQKTVTATAGSGGNGSITCWGPTQTAVGSATATQAGCYKCGSIYLYKNVGDTLTFACEKTPTSGYIKDPSFTSNMCIAQSEYQEPKTVTLTFAGTDGGTLATRSCTIAANKSQCDNDLVAPSDKIPTISGKVFNGWGESAGCSAGSYTANALFHITRQSSDRTYYACYTDAQNSSTSSTYSSSKCNYSMETAVVKDVRYLHCTYTNISYNNDQNNISGDSRGNIKQCCLDHGYTWIDSNFTSSGFGSEYCIHCGGGSASTPSSSSNDVPETPVTSCYGCKVGSNTVYTYATSSSGAASATGGNSCGVVSSSNCESKREVTSCYKCSANGVDKYTFATSESAAANATALNSCSVVLDSYCAAEIENCYECSVNGTKKYTKAISASDAGQVLGSTSCNVTEAANCATPSNNTPTVNPKTGNNVFIVLVCLMGIVSIIYATWYGLRKPSEDNN